MKRLSFLCLPLLLSAATGHAAGVWCDFESAALGSQWQVRGAVQVSRADVADAPAGPGGASGKMMLVKAGGRALIQSRAGAMPLPKVAVAMPCSMRVIFSSSAAVVGVPCRP